MINRGQNDGHWYDGVTRYQWLVLIIASLGWVFDVFEGQIFVASMNEAMPSLLPDEVKRLDEKTQDGYKAFYNNVALTSFLAGGACGGILFGRLSDRVGRTGTMILTIAVYSAFTFLSALSQAWWHLALFRFLVAIGVGGEWAVASALVAEVFPSRARAWSLAIFHASSVLGTFLAIAIGILAKPNLLFNFVLFGNALEIPGWRLGFLLGGVPALLIVWIRLSLREPNDAHAKPRRFESDTPPARFWDVFRTGLLSKTAIGVGLAGVGLATFWGVHIYGKDLLRSAKEKEFLAQVLAREDNHVLPECLSPQEKAALLQPFAESIKNWELFGMSLVTLGGGLGLVFFGPLCEWVGRRGAFLAFQFGGLILSVILFQFVTVDALLLVTLPIFGFWTLGMHAGFAVFFPELFPKNLRGTGTGVCFNVGRVLAAPALLLSGWMQKNWHWSLENSATVLSLLFLLGPLLLIRAPEARGRELA